MSEVLVDNISNQVKSFLAQSAPDLNIEELLQKIQQCSKPMQFLDSDIKQRNYFAKFSHFVPPKPMLFGPPRLENKRQKDGESRYKYVYDSWQYIPLEETLKSVLAVPELFEKLQFKVKDCNGVIESFMDGSYVKHHPLFSHSKKNSMIIELYYDGLETANPVGSKAVVHKVGMFYFKIKNLPAYLNSSTANIHLIAIAYIGDLKRYGYTKVLEKICKGICKLETVGFSITTVQGEHMQIYGSIIV